MSDNVFPSLAGLSWPLTRSPIWKTGLQTTQSGRELRAAYMSYPLYKWSATYDVLRTASTLVEFQTLLAFFNARSGSFDSFLFMDPDDGSVVAQPFGTGDGSTKTFQLVKSFGGYTEPVFTPLTTGIQILDNGVTAGANSVNADTGIVTFTTAPAAGHALTWTGSYYYRCRFLADTYDFDRFMTGLYSVKKLEFQSFKP